MIIENGQKISDNNDVNFVKENTLGGKASAGARTPGVAPTEQNCGVVVR